MKKIFLLALLLWSAFHGYAQQSIRLSQYIFTPLTLNPAYAGYRDQWYVNALYRQQWVGFEGAPKNISLTADGYVNKDKTLALGGVFLTDKIGAYQTTQFTLLASTSIYFDKELKDRGLSLGLGLGGKNGSIVVDDLRYSDLNDPNLSLATNRLGTQADAQVGVYFFLPKFYAGLSVQNLLGRHQGTTSQGLEIFKNQPHMYFNVGGFIPLNDKFGLKPFAVYKDDFHGISSVDFSIFLDFSHKVWLGAALQTGINLWDAPSINTLSTQSEMVSGIIEWFIQDRARLGYSYDFMINGLQGYQSGSHEISLGFYIKNPNNYNRLRGPRLF